MKDIKKIVAAALCGAAAIACAFGFAACTDGQETGDGEFSYSVYMPAGAPRAICGAAYGRRYAVRR